jgi:Flp pilus assembly pilin Flp
MTFLFRVLADDGGATLVEYALLSAVLSAAMIAALAAIASECKTRLSVTSGQMTALGTTPP